MKERLVYLEGGAFDGWSIKTQADNEVVVYHTDDDTFSRYSKSESTKNDHEVFRIV